MLVCVPNDRTLDISISRHIVMRHAPTQADGEAGIASRLKSVIAAAIRVLVPVPAVAIPVVSEPTNEFTNNSVILASTLPHLFCLGDAYSASVSTSQCRRMLLSYNPAFGSCAQLIFLLFNQLQRHSTARKLAALVRNNAAAFAQFLILCTEPQIEAMLQAALANPMAAASRTLIAKLESCMSMAGGLVPFSAVSRRGKMGDFIAAMRHLQPALWFNTVSPDPLGDAGALRRTFPSFSNSGFPFLPGTFVENLVAGTSQPFCAAPAPLDGGNLNGLARLDYASLISRATTHAAVAAEGYKLDVSAMFSAIYGLPLSGEARASATGGAKTPGAFGVCRGGVSVTECNGKGWLHNHGLFWAGLPSWVFQAASALGAEEPTLCTGAKALLRAALGNFVDACSSGRLDPRVHVQSLLRRLFSVEPFRAPWHAAPLPPDCSGAAAATAADTGLDSDATTEASSAGEQSAFNLFAQFACERTNVHTLHGSRCHGGVAGQTGCSANVPRPLAPEEGEEGTRPVFIPTPGVTAVDPPPERGAPVRVDPRVLFTEAQRPHNGTADAAIDRSAVLHAEHPFAALAADDQAVITAQMELLKGVRAKENCGALVDEGAVADALVALIDASRDGLAMNGSHVAVLLAALPPSLRGALDEALDPRNSRVIEFNPILTALRGCNTAIYLTSSGVAARVAMFYIIKYITKDPVERAATASLALAARKHIAKYPSLAVDDGKKPVAVRTAQYWLLRLMNSFNGQVRPTGIAGGLAQHTAPPPPSPSMQGEYSLILCASALLGCPAEPMTPNTATLNVAAALAFANKALSKEDLAPEFTDEDPVAADDDDREEDDRGAGPRVVKGAPELGAADPEDSSDSDDSDDSADELRKLIAASEGADALRVSSRFTSGSGAGAPTEGVVIAEVVEGKSVLIDTVAAYAHRPAALEFFSLYEFVCAFVVVPRRKGNKVGAPQDIRACSRENGKVHHLAWPLAG